MPTTARSMLSALAERIGLSPSRTSRLAMELAREGLVDRHRDAADSRSTRVAVTNTGRDLLLEAAPAYFSAIREHLLRGRRELSRRHRRLPLRLLEARDERPDSQPCRERQQHHEREADDQLADLDVRTRSAE